MQGRVVHTWKIGTNLRLLDNGHLPDATKDDPSGFGGFQELDWDGSVFRGQSPDYSVSGSVPGLSYLALTR